MHASIIVCLYRLDISKSAPFEDYCILDVRKFILNSINHVVSANILYLTGTSSQPLLRQVKKDIPTRCSSSYKNSGICSFEYMSSFGSIEIGSLTK